MRMMEHPAVLGATLVGLVALLTVFSKTSAGRAFFKFLPVPFYCYLLPILASTAGLLPPHSTLYKWMSQHILPPCLVLLLLGSPWGELARLGRQALLAMGAGTIGMVAGAVAGFAVLSSRLPPDSWMAAGALLGSWTGGSANMMAVKEALSMPESLLAPLIIVDTVIAYGWMAILIAMAGYQDAIDRTAGADRRTLDQAVSSAGVHSGPDASAPVLKIRLAMVLTAVVSGELTLWLGRILAKAAPGLNLSAMAWTVILATTAGLIFSVTPVRRWESAGASGLGTTILLLLLTSYGAQTNLRAILQSPAFMAFGVIMVLTHGTILYLLGRLWRLPMFYLATASQACIGGPVSTPIVAGVYQPSLTHVGVILALLGGAIGTYVGLAGAAVCRWMVP